MSDNPTSQGGENQAERNLRNLLDKRNGDAMALAADLLAENAKLREDKRSLKSEIESVKVKVPSEGALVLEKVDAERWQAYQELGKVDELQSLKTEAETAKAELAKRNRRDLIRMAGFNEAKLERLLSGIPLKVEGEGDSLTVKVTVKNEQGQNIEQLIDDWAKSEGIEDLLNVARLEPEQQRQMPPPSGPTGVGARKTPAFSAADEQQVYEKKKDDPIYRV